MQHPQAGDEALDRGLEHRMLRHPVVVGAGDRVGAPERLAGLVLRADAIARANHDWVAEHAMFEPAVDRFVARLRVLQGERERQARQ